MQTLRINIIDDHVETILEVEGQKLTEKRPFSFKLSTQDAEDIRWYLEDYRIYPVEPQPIIARRVEQRMNELGRTLFQSVLGEGEVWFSARDHLGDTRVEIETGLLGAAIPWELLRDPDTDVPLTLSVASFVRCHSQPTLSPHSLTPSYSAIRLSICYPKMQLRTFGS